MPIDVDVALAAEPEPVEFSWNSGDVQLYNLALGAGSPDEASPMAGELTYTGTLRRNGALGWTAAPCLVTAITPEPNTNTVVLTVLVYPATEDMYD